MKQIQISHETPISLLQESLGFNDYQYCLVHLTDSHPMYKEFFINLSKTKIKNVILDNSIFELETAYDSDKFIDKIIELQPTEFIIPDSLENSKETMRLADEFMDMAERRNLSKYCQAKSIGVIQGKEYADLVKCHDYLDKHIGVDKIAISFDYSFYSDLVDMTYPLSVMSLNKYFKWMYGRVHFIELLKNTEVINYDKPYHLLGCALPQEGAFYSEDDFFIESMDTSNPVVHAIYNITYNQSGLFDKKSTKLNDLIEVSDKDINKSILYHNLKKFKSFWRR